MQTIKDFKELLNKILEKLYIVDDVEIEVDGIDGYYTLEEFIEDDSINFYELSKKYRKPIDLVIENSTKMLITIYCD